jgi:hypothetical protein
MGRKRWGAALGAAPSKALLHKQKECSEEQDSSHPEVKAFEKPMFGPCTLGRTLIG